jgi:adenine-specific DNA-methyltransferase
MRELMSLATDMLCIKEDLYAEQKQFGELPTHPKVMRYFAKGDKSMLVIYYEPAIAEIVEQIEKLSPAEPIKVYVFSPSEDPWEEDFEFVNDKVELCALPAAIYNTYKRILPKKKDERVEIDVKTETETDQPKSETASSLFDFSEEGGEQ